MKYDPCPRGESAVRAAHTGRWSGELASHVEGCISCRESSRVARWLIERAEAGDLRSAPLPDPNLIWLRAKIRERSRDPGYALLPIRAAATLAVLGLGSILATFSPESWSFTGELLRSGGGVVSELLSPFSVSPLIAPWIPAGFLAGLLVLDTISEA